MAGIESVISLLTANLLAILVIFLFTYKKGHRHSNLILAFFFLFSLIFEIQYFLNISGIFIHYYLLSHAFNSLIYFMGPLLFFFTKSLCYEDFRFNLKASFHFMPYFVFIILLTIFYYTTSYLQEVDGTIRNTSIGNNVSCLYFCIITASLIFYCFLSLTTLAKYRRALKDYFSSVDDKSLSWLSHVIKVYLAIWILDLIAYITLFKRGLPNSVIWALNITSGIAYLVVALVIVQGGLKRTGIFIEISRRKVKTVRFSKQEVEEYLGRIKDFMAKEKPFLDPDLGLDSLSESMSISARYFSQLLNVAFKKNFFDFISDYRIAEAKRLLADPLFKDRTILEILYDAGFNSKSSFNALFKKKTGMTPSEFRKTSTTVGGEANNS